MGAGQQSGVMRADLTRLAYRMRNLVTKGRKTKPHRLAPMDRTYRDALGVRKRCSSCSKVVTPGSTHFRHLEGFLPAEGAFMEPFLVQYSP
jgi:hypothetical protein